MKFRYEPLMVGLIALAACSPATRPQTSAPTTPTSPAPTSSSQPAPSQPAPNPQPTTFEAQAIAQINAARAQARSCGAQRYPAAPNVAWNERLRATAEAHTRDMIAKDFFAHLGSDGSNVGARATKAGYAWSAVGENIAAGYASLEAVMRGWLESPGHCANLMNLGFTEVGLVTRASKGTKYTSYWTLVLARPK